MDEPVSAKEYLVLQHLTKRYGPVVAVDDLSLTVTKGEFVSLLGPSGCGKTTTLRMVAGLVMPTSGEIFLAGSRITELPPYKRKMGVVFQNYALFPHLTVAENVAYGLKARHLPRSTIVSRVEEALSRVRLSGYGNRRVHELSGGQQQRVALARALVIEPTVLLLDEPLSNLDAKLREEMRQEIRDIQQELGITTLFVTHDQVEALTMSDRIAVLNAGRIEQIGTPEEIYERPATRFVASFIGRANLIEAEVVERGPAGDRVRIGDDNACMVVVPGLPVSRRHVTLMIRPHRIKVTLPTGSPGLCGRIRHITYMGNLIQYDVEVGCHKFTVEQPTTEVVTERFNVGDPVELRWDPKDVFVLQDDLRKD